MDFTYFLVFCQGCKLNFKFSFCPHPPFLIHIFSPNNLLRGSARRSRKLLSLFFCNFVYFKSIGEKYAYFLTIGEKICIKIIHPLSKTFPPTCYSAIFFWGVKQKNIHPCILSSILIISNTF